MADNATLLLLAFVVPMLMIVGVGILRLRKFPNDQKKTYRVVSLAISTYVLGYIFMPPLVRWALHH
jgi:hypothetical protein